MWTGRDEFSERSFDYRPKGRHPKETIKDLENKNGPVVTRKLSDLTAEQLENEKFVQADKMKGILRMNPRATTDSSAYTSEKYAI